MTSVSEPARRLRWSGATAEVWLRPARHALGPGQQTVTPHCHDFCECFWIEAGRGEHHVNGEILPLQVGDLVFIRASDTHAMYQIGRQGLAWTNVTLRADAERRLRRIYEADLGWWPWRRGGRPFQVRLDRVQIEELREQAARLPVRGARQLDQDGFVIGLLRLLAPAEVGGRQAAPSWLREAVRCTAGDTGRLQLGSRGLVELAGRCPEHVNRVVREHYGVTCTDLVRQLRLEQAARLLRLSDRAILDIAFDCGFTTLSYFYRSFRARFGTTPRRLRLQAP